MKSRMKFQGKTWEAKHERMAASKKIRDAASDDLRGRQMVVKAGCAKCPQCLFWFSVTKILEHYVPCVAGSSSVHAHIRRREIRGEKADLVDPPPEIQGMATALARVAKEAVQALPPWQVGDTVSVSGRKGIVKWDGRPEHSFATIRWSDTGEVSEVTHATKVQREGGVSPLVLPGVGKKSQRASVLGVAATATEAEIRKAYQSQYYDKHRESIAQARKSQEAKDRQKQHKKAYTARENAKLVQEGPV